MAMEIDKRPPHHPAWPPISLMVTAVHGFGWPAVGRRSCANSGSVSAPAGDDRRTGPAAVDGHIPSDRLDQAFLEEVEVLEREARPQGDAVEGVLGDVARDAGDLGEELVDIAKERSTARHDHSLVDDVRRELRRGLLEDAPDGRDELLQRSLDRLHHLRARDRDRPWQAGDQVAPADLHLEL